MGVSESGAKEAASLFLYLVGNLRALKSIVLLEGRPEEIFPLVKVLHQETEEGK